MRSLGFILYLISFLIIGFSSIDWMVTVSKPGGVGMGSSTYACANFLLGIAVAALAIASSVLADPPKIDKKP